MSYADQIVFGVELECLLPHDDDTNIGSYHSGRLVPWLPEWNVQNDSSISGNGRAAEFVSPKGVTLDQVLHAVSSIHERGAFVNYSCGFHVTCTFPHTNGQAIARLVTIVSNLERGIFASTGTLCRENGTPDCASYSKGIKQYDNVRYAMQMCRNDRRHILNLRHIAVGNNRIEFRGFAGTLNRHKVLGHIMTCLAIVELALTRRKKMRWTYTKKSDGRSPWDRTGSGSGETELNRMFYVFGWTKGHAKPVGIPSTVDQADVLAVKAILRKMARKYDQRLFDMAHDSSDPDPSV